MPLIHTTPYQKTVVAGPSNTEWDVSSRTGVFLTGGPSITATTIGLVSSQNIAPGGVVFSNTFVTSGKYYFEVTSTSASGIPGFSIGVFTADTNRTYSPAPGTGTTFYPYIGGGSNGDVTVNGVVVASTGLDITSASDVIGIAYDADNELISYYVNGVLGTTQSFIRNGPVGPAVGADESGTSLNVQATWSAPFAQTVPSGFTQWP